MFFSEPLISKNPYNNVPFNKSTLYNIYFNIREKTYIIPELIHKFFLCDFNLNKFEKEFEHLIRDHAIQKYVKNSDTDSLYNSILSMIDYYNDIDYSNNSKISIHKNFPKKKLVYVMRPYLFLYYSHKYSLINSKKIISKNILYKKLKDFYKFNPSFGRQQVKVQYVFSKNNKRTYKNIYTYNDKHINFYEESNTFLTSHLSNK
jgi:hypothetical protein